MFEDIEEGMFAIRVSDYLRESDPEISPQPGWPLPAESLSGTGRYFSSNGDETVHFRFLVIVYDGFRTSEQIEQRFRKFASVKGD